jgi:hypothetical protein
MFLRHAPGKEAERENTCTAVACREPFGCGEEVVLKMSLRDARRRTPAMTVAPARLRRKIFAATRKGDRLSHRGLQRQVLSDHRGVNVMIQFVSHVLPPSSENACSQCGELVLVRVHRKRHRTFLPSTISSPKN